MTEKRKEKRRKKEIAIKMIRKEIDEKIIAEVTNLSLEEIEKIKEEVGNGTRIWTKKIEK